jgi:hypothetical protein
MTRAVVDAVRRLAMARACWHWCRTRGWDSIFPECPFCEPNIRGKWGLSGGSTAHFPECSPGRIGHTLGSGLVSRSSPAMREERPFAASADARSASEEGRPLDPYNARGSAVR